MRLLLLFTFQADGDLLDPGVLRQGLLVLCHCLLDFRETLLQFRVLCLDRKIECHRDQENKRDQSPAPTLFGREILQQLLHGLVQILLLFFLVCAGIECLAGAASPNELFGSGIVHVEH